MSMMWAPPSPKTRLAALVGCSPAIEEVRRLVDRLSTSSASVLITGPSGSGKEVVAQLLHQRSSRAAHPFIALNCAAVPRDLLESEIFGHEAGSFTGASKTRRGRFEMADKGALFLDEIGDMPSDFQAKLLRVLESRTIERVGSMTTIPVDVRLIAATNADLNAAIAERRFREDLFYRLAVVEIRLPSLDERRMDIRLLIDHFVHDGDRLEARVGFTEAALEFLEGQVWRGNIRELRNFVARATALYPGTQIDQAAAERLVSGDRQPIDQRLDQPPRSSGTTTLPRHQPTMARDDVIDLKSLLDQVEEAYIKQALDHHAGRVSGSARMLGLRRTTLVEKMRRLNIQRLPKPGSEQMPTS